MSVDNRIKRFFDGVKGKKVAFLGIGVSNKKLVKLFAEKGAEVYVCDRRDSDKLGELYTFAKEAGAKFRLGDTYLENLTDFDMVFRTPGMKYYLPELTDAREHGVAVTSEMEIFFELCPCKIYAVTGSDGKTTSTTVISEMLKAEGKKVHLGGNIGRALLPEIESISEDDVAVVELSSFQLISMRRSPDVALVTNLAPNHLDMHKNMQEYIDAKKNIFIHQSAFSKTVLNYDNDITRGFASSVRGQTVFFSRKSKVERGAFLDNGVIKYAENGNVYKIMNAKDIRIPGIHNVENYLGVIATVWGDVSIETMVKVAKNFGGVEHRIEFVRELDGVKYYNDSIATSPTRTIAGLNSFKQKIIIIAGGYDKHLDYTPLAPYITSKVKTLILMGATAEKIEKAVRADKGYSEGNPIIFHADSMEQAVATAQKTAKGGDIVSLCPASASFDLYPNFEARGIHYKNIVNSLK